MRISLILVLGLIHLVNLSFSALPEDLEGSGYDLENSGSSSGDWSDQAAEMKNIKDHHYSKDVSPTNTGGGTKNIFHGSPAKDSGSGFVILSNSKSFLENEDIFAGVIAGGVVGVLIAAALAVILIYKWHKKDDGGYIVGQQGASDKDYCYVLPPSCVLLPRSLHLTFSGDPDQGNKQWPSPV